MNFIPKVQRRLAGGRARGYPGDLTDTQWRVMAVHRPADRAQGGGPAPDLAAPPERRSGLVCGPDRVRVAVPAADFPPGPTVYGYLAAWRDGSGTHYRNGIVLISGWPGS